MSYTSRSQELHQRALKTIPGGVNSHYRASEKPHPLFFTRGLGSKLADADGRTYIDYVCGRGPLIFGHSPPFLLEVVAKRMSEGLLFGSQHELEVQLAEEVVKLVPCAELVRFATTGTEAVHVAVRLARAFTSRHRIVKFEGHYHGWSDSVLFTSGAVPQSEGILDSPQASSSDVTVIAWNNFDAIRAVFFEAGAEIAAVIMEPVMCNTNCILPAPGYLQLVRQLCTEAGSLLIFDEVITGFRLHVGGAQSMLGVTPDLATFAKAMAGGFPISMLTGRRDVMQLLGNGRVMHAGTANANVMSVSAAWATMHRLQDRTVGTIERLHRTGEKLMLGLQGLAQKFPLGMLVQGPGPVFAVSFMRESATVNDYTSHVQLTDPDAMVRFVQGMLEQGIRIQAGAWFVSEAHGDEDVWATLQAAEVVLAQMAAQDQNGRLSQTSTSSRL